MKKPTMKTNCLCAKSKHPKCSDCPGRVRKYVLTGGPGIGKTTMIELLATRGHQVLPEAARMVIEVEQGKDGGVLPWTDLEGFQYKVADLQLELEDGIQSREAFLDRGIIDGFGYSTLGGVKAPEIIHELGKNRYEKIFILDPLPTYENDSARKENRDEALRIHGAIENAYKHFGYDPISVPVLPPEERVLFILSLL